jgi:hypothetical protein
MPRRNNVLSGPPLPEVRTDSQHSQHPAEPRTKPAVVQEAGATVRNHHLCSDVYYVDFPYLTAGVVWSAIGVLALLATLYGVWRRSFYGLLFLVPILLGLVTLVIIPDGRPETQSMVADSNYLSSVSSFFRVWYDDHQRFPANESEFKEAIARGPSAWQYRVQPAPESLYRQRGRPLPYELVVVTNASGPRLTDVSQRPAVTYYCVSNDFQEFWCAMTGLHADVAAAVVVKRVAHRPEMGYWTIHAAGRDYPAKKP